MRRLTGSRRPENRSRSPTTWALLTIASHRSHRDTGRPALGVGSSRPTVELLREAEGSGVDRLPAEAAGIVRVLSTVRSCSHRSSLPPSTGGRPPNGGVTRMLDWRGRSPTPKSAPGISPCPPPIPIRGRRCARHGSDPRLEAWRSLDRGRARRTCPAVDPEHDTEMRRQRSLHTSEYRFQAGDAGAARRAADDALRASSSGAERAEVLYLLSGFGWNDLTEIRLLLEQAVAESDGAPDLMASAMADLEWIEIVGGDLKIAARQARRAIELAGTTGDPGPRSLALITTAYAEFMLGIDASSLLAEAEQLEDHRPTGRCSRTCSPTR